MPLQLGNTNRNLKPVHAGYLSWRSHVWTDVDNNRCGTLPFVFDDDFGFDRYVEYALDVPMYFVYRCAASRHCPGMEKKRRACLLLFLSCADCGDQHWQWLLEATA